jgi:C4-dicarboxylate-specific signal transduction histidine kinase
LKLKFKILILISPLIILPLLALGGMGYRRLYDIAKEKSLSQVVLILNQIKSNLDVKIVNARSNVALFSNSELLKNYLSIEDRSERYALVQPALLRQFISYQKAYPEYYDIQILLPDGHEDARSVAAGLRKVRMVDGTAFFREVAQQQDTIFHTFFVDSVSRTTNLLVSKRIHLIDNKTASPLSEPRLKGYLTVAVGLNDLIRQVNESRIGRGGTVFLTDEYGNVIIQPEEKVLHSVLPESLFQTIRKCAENHTFTTSECSDRMYLFSGRKIHSRLFLFAMLPESELLYAARNLGVVVLGIILITIVLTILSIFFGLNFLVVYPVDRLTNAVECVSTDEYNFELGPCSRDEIGRLTEKFIHMARQLHRRTEALKKEIDDRKTAQSELNQAYKDLQNVQAQLVQSAKLASIGEMASGIAHELNQPLMVIRGNVQLISRILTKGRVDADDLVDSVHLIEKNTRRMMGIIDHMRIYSRQKTSDFRPLNINTVLVESLFMFREQFRSQGIEITERLGDGLPSIFGEPSQLEQVFINLLANSRDAILERRGHQATERGVNRNRIGHIDISTRMFENHGSFLEVRVADDGLGIANENRGKIFDPFFTTKDVGKGTGLGLSVSYGIVEQHRGRIEIETTGPTGTSFILAFPTDEEQSVYDRTPEAQSGSEKNKTITHNVVR